MFNLGYLPTSDHVVTTKAETTMAAVSKALDRVKVGGTVVVVVYPGHPEGKREGELLLEFASSLSDRKYDATYYRLVNIPDCPFTLRSRSVSDPKGRITVFSLTWKSMGCIIVLND